MSASQFGPNSNMTVNNSQGPGDTAAVLREMILLIQELRSQVTPAATGDDLVRLRGRTTP